jgi:alpha-beta hydrolase superfamily lysophospholipase
MGFDGRKIWRGVAGARLLLNAFAGMNKTRAPRQPLQLKDGTRADLYQPSGKAKKTVLLLYGLSPLGEEDPRLLQFASGLVRAGARVMIPILPELKLMRLSSNDFHSARECIRYLLEEFNEPFCIVAFSAGGSLALSLAADEEFSPRVQVMTLISPVYDWASALERFHSMEITRAHIERDPENFIWMHYVLAHRNPHQFSLTDSERRTLLDHLRRYSHDLTLDEKFSFYENTIEPRLASVREYHVEEAAYHEFSPRSRLHLVQARVLIVHDANDPVVSPDQSQAIARDLGRRTKPDHRLLITPVLSHATIKSTGHRADLLQIIDMLGELVT